jgi:hypothetical protein
VRRTLIVVLTAGAACCWAGPAMAATPDGPGPWADTVVQVALGAQANGRPVRADRQFLNAALGVAELAPVHPDLYAQYFTSLGFGGQIVLGFQNAICNRASDGEAAHLAEATSEPYPDELADVYASQDGTNFVYAGRVVKSGDIALPPGVPAAHYLRIVDVTPPGAWPPQADGYDLDGVAALVPGPACSAAPAPANTVPGSTPPSRAAASRARAACSARRRSPAPPGGSSGSTSACRGTSRSAGRGSPSTASGSRSCAASGCGPR